MELLDFSEEINNKIDGIKDDVLSGKINLLELEFCMCLKNEVLIEVSSHRGSTTQH